jgi:PKD repeat protein
VSAIVYNLTSANIQAFAITPICPGQATTIYANATGSTGPLTYNWNNSLGSGPGAFTTFLSQPTTYIVTVTNSCGTSIQDSVRVLFNPPPNLNISTNGGNSCVPASVSFFDNSTSSNLNDPITNWFWDFGDGSNSLNQNPSHTFSTVGTYSVYLTITTNGGCTNNNTSLPSIVNVYPYPTAIFSVNSMVLNLPYDVLVCTNQSVGAMQSNWNFGDGNSSALTNPTHNYSSVGFFEIDLVVTNEFGCSDTSKLKIMTEADVIFPNAFSPNLEGPSGGYYYPGSLDNDIFFPYTSGVIDYKFQIFNRWGELIFETEDIKQGWDGYYRGKICQVGVYVWKAYIKLNSGKIFNKTGDVTLLK